MPGYANPTCQFISLGSSEGICASRARAEVPASHLWIFSPSDVRKKRLKASGDSCLAVSCVRVRRADGFLPLFISGLDLVGLMEDSLISSACIALAI